MTKYIESKVIGAGAITSDLLPPANLVAPGTQAFDADSMQVVYSNGTSWVPVGGGGGTGAVALASPDGSLNISGSPGSSLGLSAAPLNILPGIFTYAGLPSPVTNVRKLAVTSDFGVVFASGGIWQILYNPTTGTLAISSNSPLTPATQGGAYTNTLTASAGVAPYTWSLVSKFGSANAWVVSSAGVLSATPGTLGTDALMVQVSDATGAVAQKLLSLTTVVATTPAATPTFSPVAGVYVGSQSVTISCATPSPTIYYTTNGSTPTTGSTVYTVPVVIAASATLKAIATAGGFTQSAVGTAAYTINTAANPIWANVYAGGGTAFSFENFPIFKNRVREGRGFTDVATSSIQVALSAAGWPTTDFTCFLWEGQTMPSWLTGGTFKCGFIGTGSETVVGLFGGSVSNVVHGFSGAYTTFDLTFGAQGGFKVTGTGGTTTNVYAYLPGYNMGAIDDVTNANAFTTEALAYYGQFTGLRVMKAQSVEFNARLSTAANRNSLANTQATKPGVGATVVALTAAPGIGATNATLTAPWPLVTDQFNIPFHSGDLVQGRVCNMTAGATTFNWTDPLTSVPDTTGLAKVGMDGYPFEWWISLANACNKSLWLCRPTLEDGTDYAPGSFSQAMLDYIGAHWTSQGTVYIEDVNENWNFGTYQSPWGLWGIAKVKGYYATSGNDVTSYYAFRAHTFANMGRSRIPAMWGTKVKQVLCYQTNTGGTFYVRRILNALATLNGGVTNTDIHLHCTAPYLHPTLGNGDSIGTIQATTNTRAQISHLAAWTENNCIIAAHWGIPFGSYEDDGDWGNGVYNSVTNLAAAILDAGMQAPLTTHIQLGFDCGKQMMTHFSAGVSAGTSAQGYEMTNIYAAPLVTAQLSALQSFYGGFSYTRNTVSGSGDIVSGVNYADNNATISAGNGHLALNANYMPFGQNGRLPYRINCTDPRANSGPVTYSLIATFASISGSPVTDVWIGDPTRGGTQLFTGVGPLVNGANVLGNITLVKGVNHIVLGHNGAQGTSAQNFCTQLQFV